MIKFNKKGALFHWFILGILLAIGIFFMNFSDINSDAIKAKGKWQTTFINNFFIPTERTLLQRDNQLSIIAQDSILDLAKNGCGEKMYPLLNSNPSNKQELCIDSSTAENKFVEKFQKAVLKKFPQESFENIKVKKEIISGEGKKYEITSTSGPFTKYSYDTSFSLNLNYDFDEFRQVFFDAGELVSKCRNSADTNFCLKEELAKKEMVWKENFCPSDDKIFYKLFINYQTCLATADDNCFCSLNLENAELENYVIVFEEKDNQLTISNGKESYSLNLGNKFHVTPATLKVDNNEAELFFPNTGGQERDYTLAVKENIILLKRGGRLDFVDLKNNEIRLWNQKIERVNGLFSCSNSVDKKNICVESKSKLFDRGGNLLPVRYRFGLDLS